MTWEIVPLNGELIDTKTPIRAVFLHGYACSSADWTQVVDNLGPGRYLLIDFPGHGLMANSPAAGFSSLVENVTTFLQQLPTRPVLIGHSMGGMVGMAVVISHPELVSGLILAEAFPYLPAVTEIFGGPEREDDPFGYGSVIDRQTPLEIQVQVRTSMARGVLTAGIELHAELMSLDLRNSLSLIGVPTLVLIGDRRCVSILNGSALTKALGFSGLHNPTIQMMSSHHFLMFEQPSGVAQYIEKFILDEVKSVKGK